MKTPSMSRICFRATRSNHVLAASLFGAALLVFTSSQVRAQSVPDNSPKAPGLAIAASQNGTPITNDSNVRTPAPESQSRLALTSSPAEMKFEVASVKELIDRPPVTSSFPLTVDDSFRPTGGLFSAVNYRVIEFLEFAYRLTPGQVQDAVNQLPGWAANTRYDIEARASGNPTKDQFRLMMQSLLEERFHLALHFDTKEMPVFTLVVDKQGKLGPELRRHVEVPPCGDPTQPLPSGPLQLVEGGLPQVCGRVMNMRPKTLGLLWGRGARNVTMDEVASALDLPAMTQLDRPIVNRTGLTGTYDFHLEWTSKNLPTAMMTHAIQDAPSFPEALKDQLGLKIESATAPVRTVHIDHIEPPTPN